MSKEELITEAFGNLNAFKRARALEQIERQKGNHERAAMYKLRQYEYIDKLELGLRAIQRETRNQTK